MKTTDSGKLLEMQEFRHFTSWTDHFNFMSLRVNEYITAVKKRKYNYLFLIYFYQV